MLIFCYTLRLYKVLIYLVYNTCLVFLQEGAAVSFLEVTRPALELKDTH